MSSNNNQQQDCNQQNNEDSKNIEQNSAYGDEYGDDDDYDDQLDQNDEEIMQQVERQYAMAQTSGNKIQIPIMSGSGSGIQIPQSNQQPNYAPTQIQIQPQIVQIRQSQPNEQHTDYQQQPYQQDYDEQEDLDDADEYDDEMEDGEPYDNQNQNDYVQPAENYQIQEPHYQYQPFDQQQMPPYSQNKQDMVYQNQQQQQYNQPPVQQQQTQPIQIHQQPYQPSQQNPQPAPQPLKISLNFGMASNDQSQTQQSHHQHQQQQQQPLQPHYQAPTQPQQPQYQEPILPQQVPQQQQQTYETIKIPNLNQQQPQKQPSDQNVIRLAPQVVTIPQQPKPPVQQEQQVSIQIPFASQQQQQQQQPPASQPIQIPFQSISIPPAQTAQQPIQQTTYQSQEWQSMSQQQQQYQEEPQPSKKSKKKKKKKAKGKGELTDFYNLEKIKLTIELDPDNKRLRGQAIYAFSLKNPESVQQTLEAIKSQNFKKHQLDLQLHAKQVNILTIQRFENIQNRNDISYQYPTPQEQSRFQNEVFSKVSKDLHSLETKQKQLYDNEQQNPILIVQKVLQLNFKKENVADQLKPKVKILVSYFLENISDYGIKSVTYKRQQTLRTGSIIQNEDIEGTYFYTSDSFNSTQNWLPIIKGTGLYPLNWTLRFIVPQSYSVVSSGTLINKQIEQQAEQRALFLYKMKEDEMIPPEKIGFIIGKFPLIHKMSELGSFCESGAYAFFMSLKKQETFQYNKFYEKNIFNILQYLQKLINSPFPFKSLKLVFVPNLFLKSSRKQSIDYSGGLHIMDEELLFQRNQLENRYKTYKYLSSALAFNYFGGKVYEESPEDYWLLLGIRENIGNHYKVVKCGVLIYRYHIMQTIQSLYKKAKYGIERYPLQSNLQPHPAEQILNEMVYEKCELIMHMIESMIDKSFFVRIIKQLYESAQPTISAGLFLKIFKQVCGFKLKQFCQNWIFSTSCPKLTASYNYNKKNNSLDLTITQTSAMKDYFIFKKYIKSNIDTNTILNQPFFRNSSEYKQAIQRIGPLDKFYVELKRECMRWFTGDVNVMIYLTDGAEIHTQQQKMSLKFSKTSVSVNVPLICKVKKTIQNKKKEYENFAMFEHEEDDADDGQGNNRDDGGQNHHMIDNSSWKFGLNDFELQDYPLNTKNLFEVKNLESPVLWIRLDPDMEYIRKVKVIQEKNNWLFQLLQEKDIIGQIEAIKQLYKYDQYSVLEILTSVSTNENYFFKVRKTALKYLQKMQSSRLDQYWKHEKFLIKIYNQRNFDLKIGFYKSNDFTKVLEYYFDKYVLKTLSKCKEYPLKIKEDVKEMYQNMNKPPSLEQQPGSIMINFQGNDAVAVTKQKNLLDENKIQISSDQIAQLLLKLLQENDNSENPFDDSSFLKLILKALGNLDNFKYMPDIAQEIYRQYRLDYIGKFSPQFAVTKGAISGFFNLRKQIYVFKRDKVKNMDPMLEDISWYFSQIEQTEKILDHMEAEINKIPLDIKWPLEIRAFIISYQIKHTFFYQGNSFLKSLYIQLKTIDQLQNSKRIQDAALNCSLLVKFMEENITKLDYREVYLNNDKSRAIINIMWGFICLPFNYLDQVLLYWVKRLYHFLYSNEIPNPIKDMQGGLTIEELKYDENWANVEDQANEGQLQDTKDRQMKQMLAASRSAQVVIRTPKNDNNSRFDSFNQRTETLDNKLKIVLGNKDQSMLGGNKYQQQQQLQPSSIKINIGGVSANPYRNEDVEMINTYQSNRDNEMEQQQQRMLIQSLQNQQTSDNYQSSRNEGDDESIYDEFAEVKFDDIDWYQQIWDITGNLWYHEESAAFLYPVTRDDLGEYFDYYIRTIDFPIDLTTIKTKIREYKYQSVNEWKKDIYVMFKNCKSFNVESSDIHQSAVKLEKFYWSRLKEHGLVDQKNTIRIN